MIPTGPQRASTLLVAIVGLCVSLVSACSTDVGKGQQPQTDQAVEWRAPEADWVLPSDPEALARLISARSVISGTLVSAQPGRRFVVTAREPAADGSDADDVIRSAYLRIQLDGGDVRHVEVQTTMPDEELSTVDFGKRHVVVVAGGDMADSGQFASVSAVAPAPSGSVAHGVLPAVLSVEGGRVVAPLIDDAVVLTSLRVSSDRQLATLLGSTLRVPVVD
ncbi:hypothetical protein [Aeromicrobium sp.]|uniref:hypothetical protein n=1 Tax=Aeromicrobium sp. TaxID=1871063 RepID=UPI0035179BD6